MSAMASRDDASERTPTPPVQLEPFTSEGAPATPPSEEPTPARDPLARYEVLAALEDNFMPETMESDVDDASAPEAEADRRRRAEVLVQRLKTQETLTSAERAELVLAVARLCLARGVFSSDDLVKALLAGS